MSDNHSIQDAPARFKELASNFKPKLPRKLELLMPFKDYIEELLSKNAAHDDIRLILETVNVIVSTDTVHRFCRRVLGKKAVRPYKPRPRKHSPAKMPPVLPPPEKIEAKLPEQRERYLGPWSRRKRGPHITDSKNL
jgi:hypothetical protein